MIGLSNERHEEPNARRTQSTSPLEPLESRTLLSTISWDGGGADYSWLNPLNWTGDRLPNSEDDVEIFAPFQDITVVFEPEPASSTTIRSLGATENLVLSGDLTLSTLSSVSATLTQTSGTLQIGAGGGLSATRGVFAGAVDILGGAFYTSFSAFNGTALVTGATFTGDGWLMASGGIYVDGNATVHNLNLQYPANVSGPGTLTITGTWDWGGGRIDGPGITNIAVGATLNVRDIGGFSPSRIISGRTINNCTFRENLCSPC